MDKFIEISELNDGAEIEVYTLNSVYKFNKIDDDEYTVTGGILNEEISPCRLLGSGKHFHLTEACKIVLGLSVLLEMTEETNEYGDCRYITTSPVERIIVKENGVTKEISENNEDTKEQQDKDRHRERLSIEI